MIDEIQSLGMPGYETAEYILQWRRVPIDTYNLEITFVLSIFGSIPHLIFYTIT
jgi:arginine/lysine/ornithine decarboxylase